MIVLGLDPGIANTGFGLIDSKGKEIKLISCGCIKTSNTSTNQQRLEEICSDINDIISTHKPELIAAEGIFSNHLYPRAGLSLGRVLGAINSMLSSRNISLIEITPTEIKKHVTGKGNSSKNEVRECVSRFLNLSVLKRAGSFHYSDALAVAITAFYKFKCMKLTDDFISKSSDKDIINKLIRGITRGV